MKLSDLPEIDFVEVNPEKIINEIMEDYQKAYFEETGKTKKLYPGDRIRLFLYTQALREIQLRQIINDTAKQNLLKYARGNRLDNLAAFWRTQRELEKSAETRMELTFSQSFNVPRTIPSNTRFSTEDSLFFSTNTEYVLPPGDTKLIVNVVCETPGKIGNGFQPGQINIMVSQIPFMISASNLDITQGGVDLEDDDSYRERIFLAPESFSVAGPDGAYKYFTMEYSSLITDVKITSPSPGTVDIRVLLQNGEIPTQAFLDGLLKHLNDDEKRPLTDNVLTGSPNIIEYDLNLTYYINTEDISKEQTIIERVNQAIEDYVLWQKSKIGRDINPSILSAYITNAGAKRVEISLPLFQKIDSNDIALLKTKSVTYGGIEDE